MSNDKVAATCSGADPAQVRLEDLAEERAQRLLYVEMTTCCWMGKHTHGVDHVRMCGNYQTTGEHTAEKLVDYPYGGTSARQAAANVNRVVQGLRNADRGIVIPTSEERYANQYLRDMAPEPKDLAPTPVRRFFPLTTGEWHLAVSVVIAIIIVFVLYAAVFRW